MACARLAPFIAAGLRAAGSVTYRFGSKSLHSAEASIRLKVSTPLSVPIRLEAQFGWSFHFGFAISLGLDVFRFGLTFRSAASLKSTQASQFGYKADQERLLGWALLSFS